MKSGAVMYSVIVSCKIDTSLCTHYPLKLSHFSEINHCSFKG